MKDGEIKGADYYSEDEIENILDNFDDITKSTSKDVSCTVHAGRDTSVRSRLEQSSRKHKDLFQKFKVNNKGLVTSVAENVDNGETLRDIYT